MWNVPEWLEHSLAVNPGTLGWGLEREFRVMGCFFSFNSYILFLLLRSKQIHTISRTLPSSFSFSSPSSSFFSLRVVRFNLVLNLLFLGNLRKAGKPFLRRCAHAHNSACNLGSHKHYQP